MGRCLVGVALIGLLAGCTSDWDPDRDVKASAAHIAASQSGMSQLGVFSRSGTWQPGAAHAGVWRPGVSQPGGITRMARAAGGFASLPDRGSLAVYDKKRKPRTSGAYRAYPVELSEEHALNAARTGGWIVVKAPDGETISLAYERHVEHPDGNWSWIGRDASGADAVITFGADATFGTLPQMDGEVLRLTMAGGYSWLVVTDRSKIADINKAVTRAGKPDYLVPPKMAATAAADKASMAAANKSAVAPAPLAATTVDVVVGYTTGLAAALGGQSQAVTRINNLVDTANQAYANSAVNATLRLAGTVSVNYADDTDNEIALEELTGRNDAGPIPPAPAFAGLRAARETYKADLVSLLRDFRTPQNNGCGIAWLIGGGQTGIDQTDEPYGYSVVADGSDLDEGDGNTYFCREESFAHELGHNMGQAHNASDSTSSGAHAYSYGYRETSNNGFYTVMAYALPNSDQFSIRYFANPNIAYAGRPTGVANASDNTRSMNATIPIIATFRAAATPARKRNDVNADGKSDMLWSSQSSSQYAYWLMNGATISSSAAYAIDSAYAAIGTGDMDGNGRVDIVWRNSAGAIYIWLAKPTSGYSVVFVNNLATSWKLVGTGDVNGDGKSDLLWSRPSSSQFVHWVMNGGAIASSASYAISSAYTAITTGDLDGNGRADIVWQDSAGRTYAWLGKTTGGYTTQFIVNVSTTWKTVGAGDVNGDGKSDLLWSRPGEFAYWIMNGGAIAGSAALAAGNTFTALGTGDMDGNGRADVVWRNTSGQIYLWLGQASGGFAAQYVYTLQGWTLIQ